MELPDRPGYTRKAFGGFQGLPLHVDFIWNRGAYIIEIMNLDELAKDQAYEFLFVVAPAAAARRHRRAGQPDRHSLRPMPRRGGHAAPPAHRLESSATDASGRRPARCDARRSRSAEGGASRCSTSSTSRCRPASCTVLTGRSGSGKTTLLNLIAGVSLPTAGTITVGGTEISA